MALYVARRDDVAHHCGAVFRLHESVFAPPPAAVRAHRQGDLDNAAFRIVYLEHLLDLWRSDSAVFFALFARAGGGNDLTLVDDWGDEAHAPRHILAAALKQIAAVQRDTERRALRRQRAAPSPP